MVIYFSNEEGENWKQQKKIITKQKMFTFYTFHFEIF
jgi:hypothetical protein